MDKAVRLAAAALPFIIPGAASKFLTQVLNKHAARGVATRIVHLPAGGSTPARRHHAGPDLHYVLKSELDDAGQACDPSDFRTRAALHVHRSNSSRESARILAAQTCQSHGGAFDFEPA